MSLQLICTVVFMLFLQCLLHNQSPVTDGSHSSPISKTLWFYLHY